MLDVKSSVDTKVSLMHWLAAEVEKIDKSLSELIADFPKLEGATRGTLAQKINKKDSLEWEANEYFIAKESIPMTTGDLGKLKGALNGVKTLSTNAALEETYKTAVLVRTRRKLYWFG